MLRRCLPILLLAVLCSCGAPSFTAADEAAIRGVMAQQEAAWSKGDIPGFMEGYCDSACFIGKAERTCGRQVVTERYQRRYPDKAAMGRLTFDHEEVIGAGADNAWCTGQWSLFRAQDTLGGGFSLLWLRTPQGWRILRDHTY
jgi:ketosteroid isomerase-like protein